MKWETAVPHPPYAKMQKSIAQSRRCDRAIVRETAMSEVQQKDVKKGLFIIFIFFVIFVYQMVNIINYYSEQVTEAREVVLKQLGGV